MLGRSTKRLKKENPKASQLPPERIAQMIQEKAYELYCQRGCQPGHEMSDWIKAEEAIKHELGLNH